jgi:hypothetical protein
MRLLVLFVLLFFCSYLSFAQSEDSTQTPKVFSGNVGFTNNGFSIIPTFSLDNPAFVANLSFRKKNCLSSYSTRRADLIAKAISEFAKNREIWREEREREKEYKEHEDKRRALKQTLHLQRLQKAEVQ